MTRTDIAAGYGYTLTSIGNGTAYELRSHGKWETVFVQGEDATQFRDEWEALEEAKPDTDTGALLQEMWGQYLPDHRFP